MAKFPRIPKLSKKERQELMIKLCEALVTLKKSEEAAKFLTDLLSPQEMEMIAKRLEIAKALLDGFTYEQIREAAKTSYATIAKVNTWLNLSGDGFKLVVERTGKGTSRTSLDEMYDPFSWYNIKRRYSTYFWPELLVEELIRHSNKKEKEKIITILQSIENKFPVLGKKTNRRIYEQFDSLRERVRRHA